MLFDGLFLGFFLKAFGASLVVNFEGEETMKCYIASSPGAGLRHGFLQRCNVGQLWVFLVHFTGTHSFSNVRSLLRPSRPPHAHP